MRNKPSFFCIVLFVFAAAFLGACDDGSSLDKPVAAATPPATPSAGPSLSAEPAATAAQPAETSQPAQTTAEDDSRFYPWIVYWDHDTAVSECEELMPVMGSISVFAAYFDGDDRLIFPKSSVAALDAVRGGFGESVKTYLTFVNDIKYSNGKSSLKNVDLLRRLLAGQQSRDTHIDALIAMARAHGFSGVEIDYENIKKDDSLWPCFSEFIAALYERTSAEGLALRVVLETESLNMVQLPRGPEYTVMIYNLFGNHSNEPGPKADEDYIIESASKSFCLGQNVCFAFATGGFDWAGSGVVEALSESAALELANAVHASPVRDEKSGALTFAYQNNDAHTVWYADGETLRFWMETARKAGVNHFALWRLGGNDHASLRAIAAYLEQE